MWSGEVCVVGRGGPSIKPWRGTWRCSSTGGSLSSEGHSCSLALVHRLEHCHISTHVPEHGICRLFRIHVVQQALLIVVTRHLQHHPSPCKS